MTIQDAITLADARYASMREMPYLARPLVTLKPVETPKLGTFAVDKFWRLYYDPDMFHKWTLNESAGVLLHEVFHLVFDHHRRFAELVETPTDTDRNRWNMAADMAINSMLHKFNIELPDGCVYPWDYGGTNFGFDRDLTAEKYWHLLQGYTPSIPQKLIDAVNGSCQSGSSATDGLKRDFELEAPDLEDEILSETDERRVRRAAVRDIKESNIGRGNKKGEIGAIIERILEPAINPAAEIFASVKYAVNSDHGWGSQTYKKPNPRQPPGTMRLPANQRPVPEVRILIDTSGSMQLNEDLALAAGVVSKVINALPQGGVKVTCADTQVRDTQKLFNAADIEVVGRGGTRMDTAVLEVDKTIPKPDVIVCITDGETGWPSTQTKSKLIICLTRERRKYGDRVPDWAKTIVICTN